MDTGECGPRIYVKTSYAVDDVTHIIANDGVTLRNPV